MKKAIFSSIVVLLVTLASVSAETRLVPAEYATIQDAIDAAVDGDVVIVATGTYTGFGNRDIDFDGKAITVQSTDPQNPDVVTATVINCQGTEAEPHRGFYFHNNEGPDSVLAGLTITNGYGPVERLDLSGRKYDYSAGGAIFCYQSNPTITRCKIEGNRVKHLGGGMYNYDSSLTVTNCIFSDNWAGSGSGMYNNRGNPTVTNTAFVDNGADHSAGGMYNANESNSMVTNCTFSGNSAKYGGAMYNRDDSNPIVKNCTFTGNLATRNGGGIHNYASSPIVTNCIFSTNSAGEEGGGMSNLAHHNGPAINPTVVNCTFSGNSAGFDGGGIYDRRQVNPILVNCILWGNSDSSGIAESAQIHKSDGGTPVVSYCCVQGWTGILGGMGNIGDDPTFVHPATGNYHLLPGSPCINAGDPDYIYVPEEIDIDGDPRVMDGRIDMGVDEFILTPEPIIGISPTEFEIYADVGGANPENQILTIHNMGGGGTLYWMVAEDCPWLDFNPESGESTGEIDEVTLSVNISGMSSGLYICELTITADGIVNSPQTVRIILHILDNDGLLHVPLEYGTIQAAIDTAVDGQAVILAPGTYTGYGNRDLDFGGKAIAVRSTNPNDPVVVTDTVIDCQGSEANPYRGFRFHSGEGPDSVIAGLTIANGYGPNEAVGYMDSAGGAIFCFVSNPTITLCRINDNYADYKGGGIYCQESNPAITHCTFSGNSASYGAGIWNLESSPTITNCTFSNNFTNYPGMGSGGGIYSAVDSHPMITHCTFRSNLAHSQAGGIYNGDRCAPTISNCIFSGNSAGYGGAMNNSWDSRPVITNCTFSGNSAVERGGAILSGTGAHPILKNCIVWDNEVETALEIWGSATVSYSNVQGGWPGEGNIDANPYFVNPIGGDYHLLAESPCIDSGDLNFMPVPGETDIDGEPRVMGGRVDMGADEFTSTHTPILRIWPTEFLFSSYKDGPNPQARILSISNIGSGTLIWEIDEDCPWLHVDPTNGKSIGDINEVALSVDVSGMDPGVYECQLAIAAESALNSPQMIAVTLNLGGSELYVPSEYETIQAAIDAAIRWDTVIVADGIYTGPGNCDIDFLGKAITVRSDNGPKHCIIDCNGTEGQPHRGFYFHNGEDTNSILSGFTITNGYTDRGGGIYFENSSPTITNCIFRDNTAQYWGEFSTLTPNENIRPTVNNDTIIRVMPVLPPPPPPPPPGPGPWWWGNGGAVCCIRSNPKLIDCTFTSNSAGWKGGGMYNNDSSPKLTNCTFSGNSVERWGGGMCNAYSSPTLTNSTFSGNNAGISGGGIYHQYVPYLPPIPPLPPIPLSAPLANADTDIYNDTASNSIIITNCILWDNESPDGPQIYLAPDSYASVNYSDVQGGWPGEGNIDAEPLFVEPPYLDANGLWVEGDYHLLPGSPCIDAGDPNHLYDPNETDFDGRPRVIGGRIDMGAYETPIPAEVRIIPRNINLANKGNWLTCYIRLPEDYDVADIDPNSIFLEGQIQPEQLSVDEQKQVAIANFSRGELRRIINTGEVELTIIGRLTDGSVFEGKDIIRLTYTGGPKPDKFDQASNPNPDDGAADVVTNHVLSWTAGSFAQTHDVYFGTSINPPFVGNQIDTTFDPGTMAFDTTYFWRIDELNKWGETAGVLWSFTTGTSPGLVSNPVPNNGAINVDPNANLSWMAAPGVTSHDVYFGTSITPPFIGNQTSTTFEPGPMAMRTTYYWRIDPVNQWGKATGVLFSFFTITPPPP